MPATSSACRTLEPATLRERKSRSGISGLAIRAWRKMNSASRTAEIALRMSVRESPQPHFSICRIVKTPSISELVSRSAPGKSAPSLSPIPSGLATSLFAI